MNVNFVLRDCKALAIMKQEPIDDGKGGVIDWFKIGLMVENHLEEFNLDKEYADKIETGKDYNFIVHAQNDARTNKLKFKIIGIEGKTLPVKKETSDK